MESLTAPKRTNTRPPVDSKGRLVPLYTEEDFKGLHRAGRLAAEVLDYMTEFVVPGVSTGKLDRLAHSFITKANARPAPLNYKGFPKSICTSVNHVICHGIPSDRKILQNGDILNIDVTVELEGWYGDSSRMYAAGRPSRLAQRLMSVTYDCLMRSIEVAKPGLHLGDLGHAIQSLAESARFSVVENFTGHGIGRKFHQPPEVVHLGKPGEGLKLLPGMVFTIEPMINAGTADNVVLADGWTAITKDRRLSAQYEHTIGITRDGAEVFTLSPRGFHAYPYTA